MRVIAWNVAHQIKMRPIPADLPALFDSIGADVVLLNEFVDGPSRAAFYADLQQAGYLWRLVSETPGVHNQILAASRLEFRPGDLRPPTLGDRMDGSAISNFLHIRFQQPEIEMVGMRAPAYTVSADRRAYWSEMADLVSGVADRPILFAGDINMDPFKRAGQVGAKAIGFEHCAAFTVPNPSGEWSFRDKGGRWAPTRIDHVLHSSAVRIEDARYVEVHNGRVLAGLRPHLPISDHAALVFEATPE